MSGRINRNYLCVVEGQQEEMYLKHFEKLVKEYPQKILKINTPIGNAELLRKARVDYDCACLFDFDFDETRFKKNLSTCLELDRKTKGRKKDKQRYYYAYSNVCFDLWLILHKEELNRQVYSNDAYVSDVRRIYKLPRDADIKSKDVMEKILEQINLDEVRLAIARAEGIKTTKLQSDAINFNGICYFDNPDFSIHSFLKEILITFDKWK